MFTLGVPVVASRNVGMDEGIVFTGSLVAVHPITYERLADPSIDVWEALRRSVTREFDRRWQRVISRICATEVER